MKASFVLLVLPVLAAAEFVLPRRGHDEGGSTCSTGKQVCCNGGFKNYNDLNGRDRGLVDILLGDTNLDTGLVCSGITTAGVHGNSCKSQAACCAHIDSDNLIGVQCNPDPIY